MLIFLFLWYQYSMTRYEHVVFLPFVTKTFFLVYSTFTYTCVWTCRRIGFGLFQQLDTQYLRKQFFLLILWQSDNSWPIFTLKFDQMCVLLIFVSIYFQFCQLFYEDHSQRTTLKNQIFRYWPVERFLMMHRTLLRVKRRVMGWKGLRSKHERLLIK